MAAGVSQYGNNLVRFALEKDRRRKAQPALSHFAAGVRTETGTARSRAANSESAPAAAGTSAAQHHVIGGDGGGSRYLGMQ